MYSRIFFHANPFYETRVVEYTTAGVATARNLAMIVDTAKFVVEERSIAHEGQLNLSKDGRYLTAVGYSTAGFFALTGKIENGKPTLYGIKILLVGGVYTSSHLIKIVDNSARNEDWNLQANLPTATELASTTNLEQFKGVAFTPVGSSSVKEVAAMETLKIHPTLAQDEIRIDAGDKKTAISIFNIAGQQVLTAHLQGEQTLNIQLLPSGMYWVRSDAGATGRFVKQ